MPTVPVADCTCDNVCPSAANCTCLAIFRPDGSVHCCCDCDNNPIPLPITARDQVNLDVRNTELGELAEFVHRMTEADVLVPASSLRRRIDMKLERLAFDEALERIGLVLAPPTDRGYS